MGVHKTKWLHQHAKRRAFERYGFEVRYSELEAAVRSIQSGKGTFVRKRTNRVTEWIITLEAKPFRVLYDKLRKRIITFLPLSEIISK